MITLRDEPPPAGTGTAVSDPVARTAETAADPGVAKLRVLLVEDDEGDAVLVEELLADTGEPIRIRRARSLAEAQSSMGGINCVLLDLGLPDAMGLAGLRRLRGWIGRTPVVVLTGQDDERLGIDAVAAGAQDYLVKGQVTGALLVRTVRYAVQRRHVEEIESALREEQLRAQENARLERGLLPRPLIGPDDLKITTRYRPGGGRMLLGGDFYDVVGDSSGALHVLIGDVAGHGPDQAALGVALRIAWRTLMLAGADGGEALTVLDRVLVHESHDDAVFATVCALTLGPDRRTGHMWVAGHPAPLLHTAAGWQTLPQPAGPALGLLDRARWIAAPVSLPDAPWSLLLYTDGAIEGFAGNGVDRLEIEGLLSLLHNHSGFGNDPGPALDDVLAALTVLNGGPLTDDVALLMLTEAREAGQ
jgi:serine phosphatase RsbU (regulator of sigma subunit)